MLRVTVDNRLSHGDGDGTEVGAQSGRVTVEETAKDEGRPYIAAPGPGAKGHGK